MKKKKKKNMKNGRFKYLNFVMIYMIHKMLLLLKNQLNYLRHIIDFSFIIFLINCNDGKFRF